MKYVLISQSATRCTWTQQKYALNNKPELSTREEKVIFSIIGNFAHYYIGAKKKWKHNVLSSIHYSPASQFSYRLCENMYYRSGRAWADFLIQVLPTKQIIQSPLKVLQRQSYIICFCCTTKTFGFKTMDMIFDATYILICKKHTR